MEGLFKQTLRTIDDEEFVNRNKTEESAFTRNRKLGFKDLIAVLMSFTRPSVQTELDRFFKAISKSPSSFESVSKSAFTQSRRKLKPEAFVELSRQQLSYFENHAPCKKRWNEKRVVAIDGSLLNLPHTADITSEFGSVNNQYEQVVSARCSFAYDVKNELVLDAQIAPRKSCEKDLAAAHLSQLDSNKDILVFDRGYPCQWLIGLLVKQGFDFCFRLSSTWKQAYQLMEDQDDADWTMIRKSNRGLGKLKAYDLPRDIEGLRLISIELDSGEKEILVTNIKDKTLYPKSVFKELYHLRWGVEEGYKSFKKTLHIEHFTGRSAQSIRQDFYARIFMLNMASIIRSQGVLKDRSEKKPRKHLYQANKTQVLAKTKDFLFDIFYRSNIKKLINQMLKLLSKRTEIIRPQRSFKRKETSSRRRSRIQNHKGI